MPNVVLAPVGLAPGAGRRVRVRVYLTAAARL